MIRKYRKKPVVVEAIRVSQKTMGTIIPWIGAEGIKFINVLHPAKIVIHTLEGDMTAVEGDYIIKGVNGEFYPCKPDIFEKTYEVEE